MRIFLVIGFFVICLPKIVCAAGFSSPEELINGLKVYDFIRDTEGLGHMLAIEEPRQPGMAAKIVTPTAVEGAEVLWKSDNEALAWVTARPPTDSTLTETGALLLLARNNDKWFLANKVRFQAVGKYADIRFEFTGGDHSPPPIVTVTTSNGGRGASYRASATYELHSGQIVRKDL